MTYKEASLRILILAAGVVLIMSLPISAQWHVNLVTVLAFSILLIHKHA